MNKSNKKRNRQTHRGEVRRVAESRGNVRNVAEEESKIKSKGSSSFFTFIRTMRWEDTRLERSQPIIVDRVEPRNEEIWRSREGDLSRVNDTFRIFSRAHIAYVPSEVLTFSESGRAHQQRRIYRSATSQQRTRGSLRNREGTTGSRLRADLRKGGNRQCRLVVAQEADRQCLRQQVINFNESIIGWIVHCSSWVSLTICLNSWMILVQD